MKLPEHVTASFLLAQLTVRPEYGPGGTVLMVAAGCLPDLDGLTILAGWRVYRRYHRILGHGLPITLAGPPLLAWLGSGPFRLGPFLPLWLWLHVALLVHLVTDVCFYRWPVLLWWPLSSQGLGFGLVTWNDLLPTLALYGATAVAVLSPMCAQAAASVGLGGLTLYLVWRAWRPRPERGWRGWLTGDWAAQNHRFWRWLTGDFVT
jgi:hypothetical protein